MDRRFSRRRPLPRSETIITDNSQYAASQCPACNGRRFRLVFRVGQCELIRCVRCGLAQISPWNESEDLYQGDEYFVEHNRYLQCENAYTRSFNHILDSIERYRAPAGHLLDVGCGPGLLLGLARDRGWNISGIDISPWAAKYATDKLGTVIQCGRLEELRFQPNTFDAVVANHVLEHVADPLSALQQLYRVLKEDGLLAVGVPNFGSLMARLQGRRWPSLLPDQHRWQFAPRNLTMLLHKAGFDVCELSFEGRRYSMRSPKGLVLSVGSWLTTQVHMGDAMLIVATKRPEGYWPSEHDIKGASPRCGA